MLSPFCSINALTRILFMATLFSSRFSVLSLAVTYSSTKLAAASDLEQLPLSNSGSIQTLNKNPINSKIDVTNNKLKKEEPISSSSSLSLTKKSLRYVDEPNIHTRALRSEPTSNTLTNDASAWSFTSYITSIANGFKSIHGFIQTLFAEYGYSGDHYEDITDDDASERINISNLYTKHLQVLGSPSAKEVLVYDRSNDDFTVVENPEYDKSSSY